MLVPDDLEHSGTSWFLEHSSTGCVELRVPDDMECEYQITWSVGTRSHGV
jgi:hypothetical protein